MVGQVTEGRSRHRRPRKSMVEHRGCPGLGLTGFGIPWAWICPQPSHSRPVHPQLLTESSLTFCRSPEGCGPGAGSWPRVTHWLRDDASYQWFSGFSLQPNHPQGL